MRFTGERRGFFFCSLGTTHFLESCPGTTLVAASYSFNFSYFRPTVMAQPEHKRKRKIIIPIDTYISRRRFVCNDFSPLVSIFHGRDLPEEGYLAGYAALINYYDLAVPLPDRLALISQKHKQYTRDEWTIQTPRHRPEDSVMGHLTFALKYEGLDLCVFKKLFQQIEQSEWLNWISKEPTGQYSRRIWFLYEWLTAQKLPLPDAASGNYIDLLDESLQYGAAADPSKRHRVRNNLPGVPEFCPLVRRTKKLDDFRARNLSDRIKKMIGKIHPDVMARTAAFLLLKDSKASYAIEGEQPPQNRIQRWGRAIGQAGQKALSEEELLRLQQVVIDNPRFTKMGWRTHGGFVGDHDRRHGTPLPEHVSAKREAAVALQIFQ
ncbi:hypothetical protein [Flavisolibacter ginsenosidimutans]|uniref:Uncharacterized protein n=1 Tax=Flavisolibacter ginsenosidimutans TaxID=661481 RepID=A0A5B8UI31_9BACT|nr:hypothetical protein [Flavisolibacter ginsenosidimutans]QEC56304.1 hypothetical protein FSB75_10500 [Flavisolibacter ginsenosidimutans]